MENNSADSYPQASNQPDSNQSGDCPPDSSQPEYCPPDNNPPGSCQPDSSQPEYCPPDNNPPEYCPPDSNQPGYYQPGSYHQGYYPSGSYQSGYYQPGNYQSVYYPQGNYPPGYYQPGNYQSGYYSPGYYQSGYYPPGSYPTGYYQPGYFQPVSYPQTGYPPVNRQAADYSIPRQIWRIIYPVLIFIAVQLIISTIAGSIIAISVGSQLLGGAAATDKDAIMDSIQRQALDSATLVVLISDIAGLLVFIPMWLKSRKGAGLWKSRSPAVMALVTIAFFAGFNVVQMFIFSVTDIMRFFPNYGEASEMIFGGSFIMQVLTVGLAAPICEELVFRGILINRMKWLPAWAAVLIQAALFGLVHFNLFQCLYAFVAGILLGLIYIKYKSLLMVIFGHMAYNLTSVLLGEFINEDVAWAFTLALLLGFIAAAACAVALIKSRRAQSIENHC